MLIVCVLEHPYDTVLSSLNELIKLQFLKGRKAGTKFLLDAFAGGKIKIFSACWTKPSTILLTKRFKRDL
jgi:hypothetical protein